MEHAHSEQILSFPVVSGMQVALAVASWKGSGLPFTGFTCLRVRVSIFLLFY